MEAEEKQFYALLTIFGAVFGIGPFILFEATGVWTFVAGCVLTVIGLGGLLMLIPGHLRIKDRVGGIASSIHVQTTLKIMAVLGVWVLLAVFVSYLHGLRSDIDSYLIPRTVTDKQAHDLQGYLSVRQPFPVTVKVAVHDTEALEYAGQILNIFKQANWDNTTFRTTESPSTEPPFTLNEGLCIDTTGAVGTTDSKHDPKTFLQEAFTSAHIEVNCSGGIAAGPYQVFVAVGHRPLRIQNPQFRSIRYKIARWIMGLGE